MAGGSVASRAAGYGMPGVTVDGQSALEMYEVGGEAIRRARSGEGPTLIEAQTYRYFGHFGADNTLLYRTEEEEAYYHERDCIKRLKSSILEDEIASADELRTLDEKAADAVSEASKFADESPLPGPQELLSDVYAS